MSGVDDMSPLLRRRISDAVRAELLEVGVDRFRIEGVARRVGVEPSVIRARWHDRRILLMETMLARTTASAWNPDTGSLHTDLEAVSALGAEISQTGHGRALFRRVLPAGTDVDLAEICSDLWDARFRDAARILKRAAERAQLRDGIVPIEAMRMFAAAFYYDVIFADAPVRPEYAEQVIDIFLHGVLGAGGRDRPWLDVENLLGQHVSTLTGSAADEALEVTKRAFVLTREWADALIDPMVLFEAARDEQGRITDLVYRNANRAACELIGLPRSDLLGRSLIETSPQGGSTELLERYVDCLDSGKPLILNDFCYQHFDRQRRLDIRLTSAGSGLFTVTWRDVTDRFRSAQLDQRYRQLMDFSAVPAGLATPEGRFVTVNQAMADFVGYDVDTLLTMCWQDLTPPENLGDELPLIADVLANRRDSYRLVKQCIRGDGRRVWGDLSLSCIRRPDGEVEHLIAQVIDVTAQIRSQQQLAGLLEQAGANRRFPGFTGAVKSVVSMLRAALTGPLRTLVGNLSFEVPGDRPSGRGGGVK